MKNTKNTQILESVETAFKNVIYTACIFLVLSTTACADKSSDTEKAAKRLSTAETEYRKASDEVAKATKRFEETQTELEDARTDYNNRK